MPSERRGTVTEDIVGYIQRLRGTSEWRADRAGTIRAPIATVDLRMQFIFTFSDLFMQMEFPVSDVVTNFRQFLTSVKKATGNLKEADEAERRAKNSGGGRPGMY